jgi:hypothetical protein
MIGRSPVIPAKAGIAKAPDEKEETLNVPPPPR